jgi:hypothetical protein
VQILKSSVHFTVAALPRVSETENVSLSVLNLYVFSSTFTVAARVALRTSREQHRETENLKQQDQQPEAEQHMGAQPCALE